MFENAKFLFILVALISRSVLTRIPSFFKYARKGVQEFCVTLYTLKVNLKFSILSELRLILRI
jgi:hypothetical protein